MNTDGYRGAAVLGKARDVVKAFSVEECGRQPACHASSRPGPYSAGRLEFTGKDEISAVAIALSGTLLLLSYDNKEVVAKRKMLR
ncbi:hypothetical protein Y032_0031g2238 [Ancylostoma ceylanicum]|uniref:Uncharacterized protein n=1 Tax=Ancylostoma ceylanicum TaxID=53326 RepID=A0A016UPH9_9BILA|nr:hypothetical protein Y032_0031g2238 [Ancylostoma ceylanicum]